MQDAMMKTNKCDTPPNYTSIDGEIITSHRFSSLSVQFGLPSKRLRTQHFLWAPPADPKSKLSSGYCWVIKKHN